MFCMVQNAAHHAPTPNNATHARQKRWAHVSARRGGRAAVERHAAGAFTAQRAVGDLARARQDGAVHLGFGRIVASK